MSAMFFVFAIAWPCRPRQTGGKNPSIFHPHSVFLIDFICSVFVMKYCTAPVRRSGMLSRPNKSQNPAHDRSIQGKESKHNNNNKRTRMHGIAKCKHMWSSCVKEMERARSGVSRSCKLYAFISSPAHHHPVSGSGGCGDGGECVE